MDWQTGFTLACAIASGSLGLVAKALRDEINQMKHDFKNLQNIVTNMRENIPQRYATIDDLNTSIAVAERTAERVFNLLERIETKLDTKMDKK